MRISGLPRASCFNFIDHQLWMVARWVEFSAVAQAEMFLNDHDQRGVDPITFHEMAAQGFAFTVADGEVAVKFVGREIARHSDHFEVTRQDCGFWLVGKAQRDIGEATDDADDGRRL